MPEAANDLRPEYWRPPTHSPRPVEVSSTNQMRLAACPECSTEFVMGARYCHVCGFERRDLDAEARGLGRYFDLSGVHRALGLSAGSLIAFIVGVICAIAAISTGLIYSATTFADWEAIQAWRLEWLLGAGVAFLAGILLKKNR